MNDVKIIVAIPHAGHVEPMVYERLFMQEDENGNRLDNSMIDLLHFENGYGIDEKRNDIARRVLSSDRYTHVLMLDSDVVMPLDAICKLVGSECEVISGYYAKKGYRNLSCVVPRALDLSANMPIADIEENEEPFTVKAVGMGCVLIKRGVFEKITEPWFKYVSYGNGLTLSEDYNFCLNCISAGIEIRVHPRVKCGHIKKEVL